MKIPGTNLDVQPLTAIPDGANVPAELKGRPADALRVPVGFMGITNPRYYNRVFFARFGDVVVKAGNGGIFIREGAGGKHFISPSFEDTILNNKHHPSRAGLDRYQWFTDPADGVEYGFLIEQ